MIVCRKGWNLDLSGIKAAQKNAVTLHQNPQLDLEPRSRPVPSAAGPVFPTRRKPSAFARSLHPEFAF